MTRIQYYVASTLDGFIADEHDDLGWLLQFGMEAFQSSYDRFFAEVGSLVLGATTYEWVLREGGGWPYGSLPTWVLTHRALAVPEGADIRFASGDIGPIADAATAAAAGRNVWVIGGGPVAAQCLEAGRLDELLVTYMPVALGRGRPLLPVGAVTPPMRLTGVTRLGDAVEHVYRIE
ncbi:MULTISPECIES: dihydrofolate reductase family protein [unclassified Agromyces]|uniref:dihydrofolate reductase family protein n=1 Tax=unclassified Agromyces TaxID=2639701 RepID=UPI0030145AD4